MIDYDYDEYLEKQHLTEENNRSYRTFRRKSTN